MSKVQMFKLNLKGGDVKYLKARVDNPKYLNKNITSYAELNMVFIIVIKNPAIQRTKSTKKICHIDRNENK